VVGDSILLEGKGVTTIASGRQEVSLSLAENKHQKASWVVFYYNLWFIRGGYLRPKIGMVLAWSQGMGALT